jgi:hypothetical protein
MEVGPGAKDRYVPHDDGTLSIDEAARACHVSQETIRRRLRSDRLPGSTRVGNSGVWHIPVSSLITAGFSVQVRTPTPTGTADGASTLEADLRVAQALADERLARIEQLEAHVADLRLAMRTLGGVQ